VSKTKYFTLISGAELHKGGPEKIIAAEDYSELMNSKELLVRIQEEAEEYRKQVIAECEVLKSESVKEGFEQGYKEWVEQIAKLEDEITKVREETQKLIMPIALKAARKIVAAEITLEPKSILNIVMQTLKSVAQHKKIVLYVNKADFDVLDANKGKIKELFESLESLSLRERDDVEQGGLIVETEAGIINAQIKDRWINLEAAFNALGEKLKRGG
jgi:type III secretion protein L